MADVNIPMNQLKAAYNRTLQKLARQQEAVAASQAELIMWEHQIKEGEKKTK